MINMRYYGIINKQTQKKAKRGDEIVVDIVTRAGLELA